MSKLRWWITAAFLVLGSAGGASAEAPGRPPPSSMPLVGAPPEGDLLPPLDARERAKAAVEMLLVVVVALAVIVLMLRWVTGRERGAAASGGPPADLVARAQQALERMEEQETQRRDE